MKKASAFTDTAVISICRFSGEGWDRNSENSKYKNPWGQVEALKKKSGELFEKGDFYLTSAETAMVNTVKSHFSKVIVVMNVGGMADTGWFCNRRKWHNPFSG